MDRTPARASVFFAILPTLAIASLVHDVLTVHPPRLVSIALLLVVFSATLRTIGQATAVLIHATSVPRVMAIVLGSLPVTLLAAWAPLRLLRSDISSASRLAWILGEEDNAQIVGVAREVLVHGPAGQQLADQYGTGFVVSAIMLLRTSGSQLLDLDPRLAAIAVFTLSVGIAVLVLGYSSLLVLLLSGTQRRPPTHELPLIMLASAALTTIALGVSVVVPMRTGFLTFVWALAWLALGASVLLVTPRHALDRFALSVHALTCTLLVVRSWPFVLAGSAVTLVACARWVPWNRLRPQALTGRHVAGGAAASVTVLSVAAFYLRDSAFGEVLSYGRDALTIVASGIEFDRVVLGAVLLAIVVLLVGLLRGESPSSLTLVATVVAVGVSWLGLNVLALLLTGGELNYAGWKLVYAFVALGTLLVLPAATRCLSDRSMTLSAISAAAATAVLLLSSTALEIREWNARTAPREPPHALATVDAIESTSPDIAIRCRPNPETSVTDSSRMAAYFCVRWVEDAFNEDRSRGYRFDYLFAEGPTFDPIIEEATVSGHYGLLTRILPLGPGWFGWDGDS